MKGHQIASGFACGFLMALVLVIGAGEAAAQTKNVSANAKGSFALPVMGTCAAGYADRCPSGTCGMEVPSGTPTISGTFGKGTITSMCITLDAGNNVNAPADENLKHTCTPFYGDLVVDVPGKNGGPAVDTAINITGAYCHHQPTSMTDTIEGGFGIDGADSTDTAATGWGTVTGTVVNATGAFALKIKGNITP